MSGWDRRGVVTGVLTAGLVWGGGVASAAPPTEPAGFRSVADGAAAVLRGGAESDLFVLIGIFAEQGSPTEAFVDIFVAGYHCVSDDPLDAAFTELETATLEGSVDLTCSFVVDPENPPEGPVPDDVTGTAVVDLTWTAVGDRERLPRTGNRDHCVGLFVQRQATVSGDVHVVIPELGIDGTATAAPDDPDNALRHQDVVCPPALS
jgi:hypothetical protein